MAVKTKIKIMRTIKFRGKREGFDKWLYFDMSHHLTDDSGVPPDFLQYQLDVKTVGQFTGLQDKNGVDIYEGDIIRVNTYVNVQYEVFEPDELVSQEIITEVSYNELFAAFELITIEEDLYLKSWGFYNEDENNDLEIIGSIHTTPELLNPSNK